MLPGRHRLSLPSRPFTLSDELQGSGRLDVLSADDVCGVEGNLVGRMDLGRFGLEPRGPEIR